MSTHGGKRSQKLIHAAPTPPIKFRRIEPKRPSSPLEYKKSKTIEDAAPTAIKFRRIEPKTPSPPLECKKSKTIEHAVPTPIKFRRIEPKMPSSSSLECMKSKTKVQGVSDPLRFTISLPSPEKESINGNSKRTDSLSCEYKIPEAKALTLETRASDQNTGEYGDSSGLKKSKTRSPYQEVKIPVCPTSNLPLSQESQSSGTLPSVEFKKPETGAPSKIYSSRFIRSEAREPSCEVKIFATITVASQEGQISGYLSVNSPILPLQKPAERTTFKEVKIPLTVISQGSSEKEQSSENLIGISPLESKNPEMKTPRREVKVHVSIITIMPLSEEGYCNGYLSIDLPSFQFKDPKTRIPSQTVRIPVTVLSKVSSSQKGQSSENLSVYHPSLQFKEARITLPSEEITISELSSQNGQSSIRSSVDFKKPGTMASSEEIKIPVALMPKLCLPQKDQGCRVNPSSSQKGQRSGRPDFKKPETMASSEEIRIPVTLMPKLRLPQKDQSCSVNPSSSQKGQRSGRPSVEFNKPETMATSRKIKIPVTPITKICLPQKGESSGIIRGNPLLLLKKSETRAPDQGLKIPLIIIPPLCSSQTGESSGNSPLVESNSSGTIAPGQEFKIPVVSNIPSSQKDQRSGNLSVISCSVATPKVRIPATILPGVHSSQKDKRSGSSTLLQLKAPETEAPTEKDKIPVNISKLPSSHKDKIPVNISKLPSSQKDKIPGNISKFPSSQKDKIPGNISKLPSSKIDKVPVNISKLPSSQKDQIPVNISKLPSSRKDKVPVNTSKLPSSRKGRGDVNLNVISSSASTPRVKIPTTIISKSHSSQKGECSGTSTLLQLKTPETLNPGQQVKIPVILSPRSRLSRKGQRSVNSDSLQSRESDTRASAKKATLSSPQESQNSGNLMGVDSPSFQVKKPKTKPPSLKTNKRGCSSQFKKPKTTIPSRKAGERRDSKILESKEQDNKAPSEEAENHDEKTLDICKRPLTDSQAKECGSSGRTESSSAKLQRASRNRDSLVREFKRLTQRELDLDNEIDKLAETIGAEAQLHANMEQIHEYNYIRDITQHLVGNLSYILHVPVAQLHRELNLPL